MILTLLTSLFLNFSAGNLPNNNYTLHTNPVKGQQSQAYYITSISNKNALNEIIQKAENNFGVKLKFSKIKYSRLDKIRNIKISVSHDTFKQEAEFRNIFEITPIEITLNKDSEGKVTCKIIELNSK